jgi:hypothetical protein
MYPIGETIWVSSEMWCDLQWQRVVPRAAGREKPVLVRWLDQGTVGAVRIVSPSTGA